MKTHRKAYIPLDLNAPPEQRWRPMVESCGDQIIELVDSIDEHCEEFMPAVPAYLSWLWDGRVDSWAIRAGTSLFRGSFGRTAMADVKAIAKLVELPVHRIMLSNMLYDLTQMFEPNAPTACSSFSFVMDGHPVLARNMDWAIPEDIGCYTRVLQVHDQHGEFLSVVVPGQIGVLSAMRPGAWAMTLNQAPTIAIKTGKFYRHRPAMLSLQEAAITSASFEDLMDYLCIQCSPLTPFFVHVIGLNPDEQFVVCCNSQTNIPIAGPDQNWLTQTNHFQDPLFAEYNHPDEWDDADGQTWVLDSRPRSDYLNKKLGKKLPTSEEDAMKLLKRPPIFNENTGQSMVFCPGTGSFNLRHR